MAQLLGAISSMVEKATRPPPPPIDRTLPQQPVTRDNLDENIAAAKKFYNMGKPNDFHVAVIGGQGVGKSSLINAICSVRDFQSGAAPVGESNSEPKPYRSSMQNALVLWEMPGAGVGHPSLTYFVDKKLCAFELLLLVSDRFHRVDFDVARCASRLGRRLIFVRTKADIAIQQIMERKKSSKNDGTTKFQVEDAFKALRVEVEASFREGLRISGLSDKWNSSSLFIVSAKRYMDGPDVYCLTTDDEVEDEDDEEKHNIDEVRLMSHLTNLIHSRAVKRSRTINKRTLTTLHK